MNILFELFLFVAVIGLFVKNYSFRSLGFLDLIYLLFGIIFYLLWVLARFQLRKYFAIKAEARGLMTKGLYSKFRNPIYLFASLSILFAVLPSGSIAQYFMLAIIVYIQVARAKKEAAILEKKFGKKYLIYKSKTWF